MTEVPPPPPPPGATGGPPVQGPGAPPPPPPTGGSSSVPPAPAGATGSVSAGGGRPGGGVNKGLLIGIVAAIVAVLGLGVVLVLTDDDGDDVSAPDRTTEITSGSPDDTTGGEIPEPSREPDGLGDDGQLDGLADVLADWASDPRAGDRPDGPVDVVTADVARWLEELGVPREERTRPPRRRAQDLSGR